MDTLANINNLIAAIPLPNLNLAAETQTALDNKTKPQGSLGRLEEIACQVAAMQGTITPRIREQAIVVMAGDHGIAAAGVSAFPQEVTGQMLHNFATGGAAINVLARHIGARVEIIDMGTVGAEITAPSVRNERVGASTADFTTGPAMTKAEVEKAVQTGIRIANELIDDGVDLIGLGDMGIGNTTASSALTAAYLNLTPEEATGRGTGVDDEGLTRKIAAVRSGLKANKKLLAATQETTDSAVAWETLRALGGFEIAGLAGIVIAAAARRTPVLLDGFITSAAALAAVRIAPAAGAYLLPSHCSVEIGHQLILKELGLSPLFDFQMRLGEGSGAVLAMPFVAAALKILAEMATFESAGVGEKVAD